MSSPQRKNDTDAMQGAEASPADEHDGASTAENVVHLPVVHPAHRPTTYTVELVNQIAERLAEGALIPQLCAEFNISVRTLFRWRDKYEYFADLWYEALNFRKELRFDDCHAIARDEKDVQRARLRIEVIMNQAEKGGPHVMPSRQDDAPRNGDDAKVVGSSSSAEVIDNPARSMIEAWQRRTGNKARALTPVETPAPKEGGEAVGS